MPQVSVIIPSYNHEAYIAEAIESVLEQTYQDFEIVIVDDGSNDNSLDVIKTFKDHRIKLFSFVRNQGACHAVKKLIEESTGEYIALLNSDDVFFQDKLEKQVQYLEQNQDIGAVFSYAKIIGDDGQSYLNENHPYFNIFRQKNRSRLEWLRYFFYHGNCLCHPSMLIRRECYEEIGLYDPRFRQLPDFDFWIRLCLKYNIHILPEELIKFRIRNNELNTSGSNPENKIRLTFEYAQLLQAYLGINKQEDLEQIFKDKRFSSLRDNDLQRFLIAKKALEVSSPYHKLFAVDTIFKLMGNWETANKIEKAFNFSNIDLQNVVASNDVFNLYAHGKNTRLYLDTGMGFNENEIIEIQLENCPGYFNLKFSLKCFPNVKGVRWDPLEGTMCSINKLNVSYLDKENNFINIPLSVINTNGLIRYADTIVFDTLDPMIYFSVCDEVEFLFIEGQISLLASPDMLSTLYLETIRQGEQLKSITESFSWKVTAPLRWFIEKMRNLI